MVDRTYGASPTNLGVMELQVDEMMFYQYLPIKLSGQHAITREERLAPFDALIGKVCCDFVGEFGLDRFVASNVYLTAKNMLQTPNNSFNRPGFHTDGFMTPDINYIWSNNTSTIFSRSTFNLSQDDQQSLVEMTEQEKEGDRYLMPNNSLVRLDQYVVHAVQIPQSVFQRCFFKLSFSTDRYDLVGNSKNHMLDYTWPMRTRSEQRNIPQTIGS